MKDFEKTLAIGFENGIGAIVFVLFAILTIATSPIWLLGLAVHGVTKLVNRYTDYKTIKEWTKERGLN